MMIKGFLRNIRSRRLLYRGVLLAGDAVCVLSALWAAYALRFYAPFFLEIMPVTKGTPPPSLYWPLMLAALAFWLLSFAANGFYERINLPASDEFLRLLRGTALGWMITVTATYLYWRTNYSRVVLMMAGMITLVGTFAFRELMKALYHKIAVRWWEPHTVLVLGEGRLSQSVRKILSQNREIRTVHGSARNPAELKAFLESTDVREVFVSEPGLDHRTLVSLSDACTSHGVPFRIVPDVLELRMGEVVFDDSLGLPTYEVKPLSLHGWNYFFKRCFDVVAATLVLSFSFFPLAFIALLIRLDSKGPILFRQPRMGLRSSPFPFFKFRTMVVNADVYLQKLKELSDRKGPVFKMKNDPRVTSVGRWLRKFSLDEVPQLINVLRGDMSLVGPRPQVLWEAAAYDEWAKKRLNVLPGITGLWQVSGRASLSYEQMIELDIFYIEHWSPGLDLKVLLKTIPTILSGQGAY